ncbi:UbiA family prenyltransferase [Deinococcus ruber]|uniref:UbiA family prenyltransferase n=1 Tax=Deinococcus ruber TaxID=1848197 RepID=UPI0027E4A9CC|nr:UbiA family prenyltransferase [Deinococcus ruber]
MRMQERGPRSWSLGRAGTLSLRQLLTVSRPALWINTVGVLVTGLWLAGDLYTLQLAFWVLLVYLTLPYNLLIYGLNDLADAAEDALNPRKGGWQGARLQSTERGPLLLWIAALNVPFLLALAWLLPPAALGVLLLSALLFAGYSVPPLRFKARFLLDGLSNVAYALPLLLPALLLNRALPLTALLALGAYSVGKHAFDAAQDIPSDQAAGLTTTATRLGVRGAAVYALGWFALAAALLWVLSPLSAGLLLVVCGGMALRLCLKPQAQTAARLYPLSILSPWIVGGVSGVQLVYLLVRGVQ